MNKYVNEVIECVGPLTDWECVGLYTVDPNGALAVSYKRYAGMLHSIGRKFFSFSKEDIDSIVWETLNKALSTFKFNRKANFATYVTKLMNNAMRNEYRALRVTRVQRDWYVDVEWESCSTVDEEDGLNVFSRQGIEEDWGAIDIEDSIESLPLTPNQYAYIECIVRNGHEMKDAEVAKEIGVTNAAIGGIKKSLAKKLDGFI